MAFQIRGILAFGLLREGSRVIEKDREACLFERGHDGVAEAEVDLDRNVQKQQVQKMARRLLHLDNLPRLQHAIDARAAAIAISHGNGFAAEAPVWPRWGLTK